VFFLSFFSSISLNKHPVSSGMHALSWKKSAQNLLALVCADAKKTQAKPV